MAPGDSEMEAHGCEDHDHTTAVISAGKMQLSCIYCHPAAPLRANMAVAGGNVPYILATVLSVHSVIAGLALGTKVVCNHWRNADAVKF